jgi:hypothetical protein
MLDDGKNCEVKEGFYAGLRVKMGRGVYEIVKNVWVM